MLWRTVVALLIVLALLACHAVGIVLAIRVQQARREGTCPGVPDKWMAWPLIVASGVEIFVTLVLVLGGFFIVFQHTSSRREASIEDRAELLRSTVAGAASQTLGILDAPPVEPILRRRLGVRDLGNTNYTEA